MINLKDEALVSVIIPCYNHGRYLSKAIESVLAQTYNHFEIIVVDDGSVDNTKEVAQSYKEVTYVHQDNKGISATRNTGIDNSSGKYIVFLDADDWLLPDALKINLKYIESDPKLAFVSGGFQFFYEKDKTTQDIISVVEEDHYCHLLESNFIAMIASMMFQRWVFDSFRYDTNLRVCEDYELYLRVARKHPIFHHTELIAVYFIHDTNVSKVSSAMLDAALQVLDTQKSVLMNDKEKHWFKKGQIFWKNWYCKVMYTQLVNVFGEDIKTNKLALRTLRKYNKPLYFRLMLKTVLLFLKPGD
jgi:glycosyltransferase involved in cell wall biosynthesis